MTTRNIEFTIFEKVDIPISLSEESLKKQIRYLVYQVEKCPKTNKIHYQGYAELLYPMSYKTFQNILKIYGTFHCRNRLHKKGATKEQDRNDARKYCMKEESRISGPYEFGIWNSKGQGNRSDLDRVIKDIKDNKPISKIAIKNPREWIKYNKGIQSLRHMYIENKAKNKTRNVGLFIYSGGFDVTDLPIENYYHLFLNDNKLQFDGYDGEKTLVIDNFNEHYLPIDKLLWLLKPCAIRLNIKFGHTYALWKSIFIISDQECWKWYKTTDMINMKIKTIHPDLKKHICCQEKFQHEVAYK